jgi:hypothetical protein
MEAKKLGGKSKKAPQNLTTVYQACTFMSQGRPRGKVLTLNQLPTTIPSSLGVKVCWHCFSRPAARLPLTNFSKPLIFLNFILSGQKSVNRLNVKCALIFQKFKYEL